jgi:hypothetical protein
VVLEHLHGAERGTTSQDFMAKRALVVLVGAVVDLLVVVLSFAYRRELAAAAIPRRKAGSPHILNLDELEEDECSGKISDDV